MKISKMKIYTLLAYFMIIIATLIFINIIREYDYKIWLQYMGWYVIFHMIVSLFCLYLSKVKLFSLSGFFVGFSYIFHFGQIMILAISENYQFTILNYSRWLNSEWFKDAIELSLLVIMMVVLGMLLSPIPSSKKSFRVLEESDNLYKKMGWIILIISLPVRFIIDFQAIRTSAQAGYLAVFELEFSGVAYQIASFYVIGIVFLLIAYRKNIKKANLIFIITCAYNAISMLSGGRGRAMINILLVIYIFFTVVKKIRVRQVVTFFLIGYVVIMVLNALTTLRTEGISSVNQLFVAIRTSENNPFLRILEEFGGTIYTVYQSILYVPNQLDYSFGATYLYSLSQIFLNFNGLLNDVGIAASFSKNISDGSPMGGSYIGELYYNFGYFSIMGGLFIGVFVNKISLKIEQCINDCDFYKLSFYLMLFVNIIWWVRAAFMDLTRAFVWGAILIWVTHYLARKVIFSEKKN
ncbi:O-antigen polysaccharide polymerase Wzy [Clostridium vincentii]|uniref:O-antigen polysaccharide polymerase Wzy n=1 Tax=Clostridium vincentii TaxID=52704 RepID=A0A2T0BD50_9CLOT|nr:O-antigen polysaccharide polymerase Wzy [Clostridium vincentii]PRR81763.1 hypothetical protein CLVI_22520 [Clostridium vincentii]